MKWVMLKYQKMNKNEKFDRFLIVPPTARIEPSFGTWSACFICIRRMRFLPVYPKMHVSMYSRERIAPSPALVLSSFARTLPRESKRKKRRSH